MSTSFCYSQMNCTLLIIHTIVFSALLLMVTSIYTRYLYGILLKHEGKVKSIYPEIINEILFFTVTLCGLICLYLYQTSYFHLYISQTIISSSWGAFYGIQSLALLQLFFYKVQKLFQNTKLRLNNPTIIVFRISLFTITALGIFMVIILESISNSLFIVLACIFIFLCFLLMTSVSILVITKLIQTYQGIKDQDILFAITRIAVLNITCVIATICHAISALILTFFTSSGSTNNDIYGWIHIYVVVCDLITNFICISLTFKPFKRYYEIMCVCLDTQCQKCWRNMLSKAIESNHTLQLEMQNKSMSDVEMSINLSSENKSRTFENSI